jgi:hypothetical protein
MIEKFFDEWYDRWGVSIGIGQRESISLVVLCNTGSVVDSIGPAHRLPPYVQILVTHTRLSLYSSVINHPTAPTEVRNFFHSAGLSSALNVVRAAIQGESQLTSMPNNTGSFLSSVLSVLLSLLFTLPGLTIARQPS